MIARLRLAVGLGFGVATAVPVLSVAAAPAPTRVSLDRLHFHIDVPKTGKWSVEPPGAAWDTSYGFLTRSDKFKLDVSVDLLPASVSCKDMLAGLAATGAGKLVKIPEAIPGGWSPQAFVQGTAGSETAIACTDAPGGVLTATFYYEKKFPLLARVKPLLVALTKGARAELTPRTAPSTRSVHLAESDLDVNVPNDGSAWVRLPHSDQPGDRLARMKPGGASLIVDVRLDSSACSMMGAAPDVFGRRFSKGSVNGDVQSACATGTRGTLGVDVQSRDSLSPAESAELTRVLDGIAGAAGVLAPGEAPPKQHVRLVGLNADVDLPATGVTWSVDHNALGDTVTRSSPDYPRVSMTFRDNGAGSCAELVDQKLSAGTRAENPAYLPSSWYKAVREVRSTPTLFSTACIDGKTHRIVAFVFIGIPAGSTQPRASELSLVKDTLAAVGAAVGSPANAGGGSSDLSDELSEMPLPVLGFPVSVKMGDSRWTASAITMDSGARADVVRRIRPYFPLVSVRLHQINAKCRNRYPKNANLVAVSRPGYLSSDWNGTTFRSTKPHESLVIACMDVDDGLLEMQIVYSGEFDSADFASVEPYLADLTRRARDALIRPVTARTPSSSASSPPVPPPPRDDGAGGGFGPAHAELLGFMTTPDDARISKNYGADVAVEGALPSRLDGTVDFAADYAVSLGYDSASNIGYDGHLGIGIALGLGPVALAPTLGVGVESRSGGGDDRYKVPFAPYYYFGGRLRAPLGKSLAIEAAAARVKRTDNTATVQIDKTSATYDVVDEIRATGRLILVGGSGETSLSVHFADYKSAKLLGLGVARSF